MQKQNEMPTHLALESFLRFRYYLIFFILIITIKIFFDENGGMKGASITQFLLEKARVVQPPAGERNYSIFYSLVEGCDHASRRALGLNPGVHNYRLLSPSSFSSPPSAAPASTPAEQAADVKNFQTLVASFTSLGLASQLPFIFEVLAAILHLGNIT